MNVRFIFWTVAQKFSRWYQSRANGFRSIGAGPVFGAILALALCGPSGAQAATISFQDGVGGYTGGADTYIFGHTGGYTNQNFGGDTVLQVYERETDTTNDNRALLSFNLTTVPANNIVIGATLTLYQQYSSAPNFNVINSLYVMNPSDAWTQGTGVGAAGVSGATWDYKDGAALTSWAGGPGLVAGTDYNATPVANEASPGTGGTDYRGSSTGIPMTFTLNSPAALLAINNWIDNPSSNAGFFMRQPDGSFSVDMFASSNQSYTDLNPVLTLTTVVVPEPSTLVLAGIAGVLMLSWRRRSNFSRSCRGQANGFRAIGAGIVICAILALALCGPSGAQAGTVSFQQGVNSYAGTQFTTINAGTPTGNFGGDNNDYLWDFGGTNVNRDLISFNLGSLAPNVTTVTSATLTLYQTYSNGQPTTNSLYVVDPSNAAWTQGTATGQGGQPGATWNDLDGVAPTPWHSGTPGLLVGSDYSATPVATAAGPLTGFDSQSSPTGPAYAVTFSLNSPGFLAAIDNWINNPTQNAGFFITASGGNETFFASDNSFFENSLHPLLTLTTVVVPEPSTLVLAGIAGVLMLALRRRSK